MKKCKIRYIVVGEMKKNLESNTFWISAAATMFIFFCVTLYNDSQGACISPSQIMFLFSKEEQLSDPANSFWQVMKTVRSGHFIIFAPMLAGVAVIPMLCGERECGVFRYAIIRSGKKKQALGKLLASMLCGGLSLLAGYVMFGIAAYVMLPHGKDYPNMMLLDSYLNWIPKMFQQADVRLQYALIMVQMMFGVFCFGAVNALWTYLVAVFVKNKYIAACIPYVLVNFINDILSGNSMKGIEENTIVDFVMRYVMPNRVLNIGMERKQTLYMLISYVVICFLLFLLHYIVLERRSDCGK